MPPPMSHQQQLGRPQQPGLPRQPIMHQQRPPMMSGYAHPPQSSASVSHQVYITKNAKHN